MSVPPQNCVESFPRVVTWFQIIFISKNYCNPLNMASNKSESIKKQNMQDKVHFTLIGNELKN